MLAVLSSLPGFILSLVVSILIHPRIYHENSSSFAKLRGGPSIGVALVILIAVGKRRFIRDILEKDNGDNSTADLLAMIWAAVEVAAGTFVADLLRGWKFDDQS